MSGQVRISILLLTLAAAAVLLAAAWFRVRIDMDVASSLPAGDPVVADAVHIFRHHPMKDRMVIDIGLPSADRDRLVEIARQVEERLTASGLFASVGAADLQGIFPQLISHVTRRLPDLLTAEDLDKRVRPRITPAAIRTQLESLIGRLHGMETIGQASAVATDPLGLRELALARLSHLTRMGNGQIYRGQILSADGRHALVLATPKQSGTDTGFARRLAAQVEAVAKEIRQTRADAATLTAAGSYRAALDNETIVRRDVGRAVGWATAGIALLLLAAFPRPLLGLLALLPALAGTAFGFFVYSWFFDTISIMVLGFGGAVISITVDHGITYMLFLDRPQATRGRNAAQEVRAIGLLAALTSIGAFGLLTVTGFPIFRQLGIFTALGIAGAFLFVHLVMPAVFVVMPPAASQRPLPLNRVVDRLTSLGAKGALAAGVAALVLLFWIQPRFNTDLGAMNSVSRETRAADALMADVWGDVFRHVYLLVEAPTLPDLQRRTDRLQQLLETGPDDRRLLETLTLSAFFPGPERRETNRAAWHRFWTPERIEIVTTALSVEGRRLGFTADAFAPFQRRLAADEHEDPAVPGEKLLGLLGVTYDPADRTWRQVAWGTPDQNTQGATIFEHFQPQARVFDPGLFSDRIGRLLFASFSKLLLIVGVGVTILLLIFFADWRLALLALLPLGFSLACTLGTLGLGGRPLDIPALMLAIIILGMGVDYSLFMVCAYQRYQKWSHPLFARVRMAVFMASASTLIGFGVLCGAEHRLLKSAGLTSTLGIGFCMLGAFVLLPPLLKRRFEPTAPPERRSGSPEAGVRRRYRNLEAHPRLFAYFKMRLDPMFSEMAQLLPASTTVHTVVDVGCGYAVPANWLLERFPDARVFGIEPREDRVRVAALTLAERGRVIQGLAPAVPDVPDRVDLALMLDMSHFLDDEALGLTLTRLRRLAAPGARLLMRAVLRPDRPRPWLWWWENLISALRGTRVHYRTAARIEASFRRSGWQPETTLFSGRSKDLQWLIARPMPITDDPSNGLDDAEATHGDPA